MSSKKNTSIKLTEYNEINGKTEHYFGGKYGNRHKIGITYHLKAGFHDV
jgi:hypothetical protein